MSKQQGFSFSDPPPMPDHVGRILPRDPNLHPVDVPRLTGQNARLLALLQSKREVTNAEILALGVFNHTGRISDLRGKGYVITSRRGDGGVWWYSLEEST